MNMHREVTNKVIATERIKLLFLFFSFIVLILSFKKFHDLSSIFHFIICYSELPKV